MLVKFNSDAGALTTFGEVAVKLLKMMGQTGDVPGALLAADIPAALERLRRAVAAQPDERNQEHGAKTGDEAPVSLRQRAYPLIQLMDRAARQKADLIWEEERPSMMR